ncbi:hypothetical protein [Streptomyces uncialis]|uniref:hypothetical protein n=1 Tax=Streptomyces uncialis TaxID=1048205 RepID=UPI001160E2DE|nr:hypothetical protein [Streptomyces uncialis]
MLDDVGSFPQRGGQHLEEVAPEAPIGFRLSLLRTRLDALGQWQNAPWAEVAEFARDAVLLVWDELRSRGIWETLHLRDQAALHWSLGRGRQVSSVNADFVTSERYSAILAELCAEAAYFATLCDPKRRTARWPESSPSRSSRAAEAETFAHRFRALSPDWQAETFRLLEPPERYRWESEPPPPHPSLAEALTDAEAKSFAGQQPPKPLCGDRRQTTHAVTYVGRFHALPHGWQTEVMRRLTPAVSPCSVVSQGGGCINVIRSDGVYLAWNARHAAPKPTVH